MNYKKIFFLLIDIFNYSSNIANIMVSLIGIIGIGFATIKIISFALSSIKNFILKRIVKFTLAKKYITLGHFLISIQQTPTLLHIASETIYDYTYYDKQSCFCRMKEEHKTEIYDLLDFLINIKIDLNIPYSSKYHSILNTTCIFNNITLTERALKSGGNPNIQVLEYTTDYFEGGSQALIPLSSTLMSNGNPLTIAFLHNNHELIKLLIRYKAEPFTYEEYYYRTGPSALLPYSLLKCEMFTEFNHLLDWHIMYTNEYNNIYDQNLFFDKILLLQKTNYLPKDISNHIALLLFNSFKHHFKFEDEIEKFTEAYPIYMKKINQNINQEKATNEIKTAIIKHKKNILDDRIQNKHLLSLT